MTNSTQMIEISREVPLGENTEAIVDVTGAVTIVADITLPESEQTYVHLTAEKVATLANLLIGNQ